MRKLLLLFLLAPAAWGQCTAGLDPTSVQNAINAAAQAGTVTLPAGSCSWTTGVTISGKGLKIQGAGSGRIIANDNGTEILTISATSKTVNFGPFSPGFSSSFITNGMTLRVSHNNDRTNWMQGTVTAVTSTAVTINVTVTNGSASTNNWLISTVPSTIITNNAVTGTLFSVSENTTFNTSISGIKFASGASTCTSSQCYHISVGFTSGGQAVLIHDNWFEQYDNSELVNFTTDRGVIWNNSFDSSSGTNSQLGTNAAVRIKIDTPASGQNAWILPSFWGTADTTGTNNLYIETNDFHAFQGSSDLDDNGRMVWRYNLMDGAGMGGHGADTSSYGARTLEYYNNTINLVTTNAFNMANGWLGLMRGGSIVIHDNIIPLNQTSSWATKADVKMTVMNLARSAGPNPCWGAGGTPGQYYHAPRQIGMGRVTGNGTANYPPGGVNNSSTDSVTYVGDSEPLYFWNNRRSAASAPAALTQIDKSDYTPNQCTNPDLVANYIVDGRDLFNTATTPKPNYTPYPYPHPLTTSGTPAVSLSPSSLSFGNVSVGSTSPSQTVKLTNTGTATLSVSGISLTGTNPADFAQSNNCGVAVLAGGSCNIVVTCTPASAASFSANISVSDNAAGSPQTVGLTCTGVTGAAAITFTPTQITFASQGVGTSSTATPITVTNSGSATLNISQVLVSGGNSTSFTQTNNCTIALQPLDQCTVFVTFTPTVAGNLTSCICFTDNAPGSPQSVVVSGTGVGTSGIGFVPTSLAFGNQTVSSTSSALSVTVSNSGSSAITLSSVAVTGTNAVDFAIFANTCGTTIAVGGSCVVQAKFTPSATGSRTANLTFTDNAPASPQNVALTGTGTQAGTGFSPTSLAFGNQNTSTTSAPLTTTLTNTGTATLNISGITITGANASDYAISTKTCGATLAAAATCTVSVTFTPSVPGSRVANLSFADNAPTSPQTVPLTGNGLTTDINVSPSSLSFAATVVGQSSATQTVTAKNAGSTDITITSVQISGGNGADFTSTTTCGATLVVGSSCTATVTFSPTAIGARSSALVFTDSVSTSPQSVALTGTGTASGAVLSPTSVAFANQPVGTTSAASNVTLTNNGTATLNISGVTLGGTDPSYFAISANTCGSTLAISASCTVSLTFTPQTAITASATLSFADDGPGSPQVVSISGLGTTLSISLSPVSIDFGIQALNTTSKPQLITLSNTGNGTIVLSGITITGAQPNAFTQTTNCGSTIAGGGSCTITITFHPAVIGIKNASVTVADNVAGSPQMVSLQGNGQATSPVVCLSQTTLVFGNQTVGTTSNPQVVIVSNTGNATLTINSATITGANPGDFGENTTCTGTLAPNASCTYSFVFTPTAAGTRGATFNLATNAPSSPDTVTLSGTGVSSPNVQPGPAPQVFGMLGAGSGTVTCVGCMENFNFALLNKGTVTTKGTKWASIENKR